MWKVKMAVPTLVWLGTIKKIRLVCCGQLKTHVPHWDWIYKPGSAFTESDSASDFRAGGMNNIVLFVPVE